MPGFLREHSWSITVSVLLHAALAGAALIATLVSFNRPPPLVQPLPIDAVVIDSQVLHAAQHALEERAEQEAARARAAAEARAAADTAAAEQTAQDQQRKVDEAKRTVEAEAAKVAAAADAQRVADAQKVAAAKHAEELKRAEEAKRAEDAKQAEEAKRAAEQKAKAEREAELHRQLAEEEHVSAVEASPARAQYIARLSSRIQNAWIKPLSARAGLDCIVNITQIPGGEVISAQVSKCNGDAAARQSIENAVYRASPLPSPPDPALFERNLVIHFHPEE